MVSQMRKAVRLSLVFVIIAALGTLNASGQQVRNIRTPDLEKILKSQDDRLYVVNFWATWCGPCVRELPHFEKLSKIYDPSEVQFVLISLDFPSEAEKQLIPFLKKSKISLEVALMLDLDYNEWIGKVDPEWQGNLPATLVFNNPAKTRTFYPGEVDEAQLKKIIDKHLN